MGFLFFKTAKEKERAERREKRHALRRAEGVIDEVVDRIKKMEKDADAEWARAKEAAKEGKQAAAQRALTSYRSTQVLITKLEQKKWVFKQVLMKLATCLPRQEILISSGLRCTARKLKDLRKLFKTTFPQWKTSKRRFRRKLPERSPER